MGAESVVALVGVADAEDVEGGIKARLMRCMGESGDKQPVGEIARRAENHERRRRSGSRAGRHRLGPGLHLHRHSPADCSTWPPNPRRIADSSRSPKLCSSSERKRAKSAADRTYAGTASSTAAITVQRPSPESATWPVNLDSVSSRARAAALRSSSQEEITLPRRHTSAMSARLRE